MKKRKERTSKLKESFKGPQKSLEELDEMADNAVRKYKWTDSTWAISTRAAEAYDFFLIQKPCAFEANGGVGFPIYLDTMRRFLTHVRPPTCDLLLAAIYGHKTQ
jgi:hypothetical protein